MVHGLATIRPCVDYQAIAVVQVVGAGNLAGLGEKSAQQGRIFRQRVGVGGDVPLGNHEHMHGGLRVNIGKRKHILCFMETLGRDRARNDLAKQAV